MRRRSVRFRVRALGSTLVASAERVPRQPHAPAAEDRRVPEARVVYHEAGHAVAAAVLGLPLVEVTVEPSPEHAGLAGYVRLGPRTATSAEDRAVAVYAGAAAASRLLGVTIEPTGGDVAVVDSVLRLSSIHPDRALPLELRLEARARELVAEHWHLVEALAARLRQARTMTGAQVRDLLGRVVRERG